MRRGPRGLSAFSHLLHLLGRGLVLGLLVQIPAVGASYAHPLQRKHAASPEELQNRVLYEPAYSPLVGQWLSFLQAGANLRSEAARAQISILVDGAQPEKTLLLAGSYAEALCQEQQRILAFNLSDLWLVSAPWLRRERWLLSAGYEHAKGFHPQPLAGRAGGCAVGCPVLPTNILGVGLVHDAPVGIACNLHLQGFHP